METETTFVAPEGVYTVTEEHKPALFQPHTLGANPQSFSPHVCTLVVRFPPNNSKSTAPGFAQLLGGGRKDDAASLSSSDTPEDGTGDRDEPNPVNTTPATPGLFSQPSAVTKKKAPSRPKHNIKTTSSTFITRTVMSEGGLKALQAKGTDATFMFYNTGKSFMWVDAGSKAKEPLGRVTFAAYPTCHDINVTTASAEHMDVIIGFSTGDLIWLDPISARYGRLNKQVRCAFSSLHP